MEDQDQVQQNSGAQQGNLHLDSDNGNNDTGKQGSTLGKSSANQPDETNKPNDDDNENTRSGTTPSHGGKQEPDATRGV
jgi:hypothetical protein